MEIGKFRQYTVKMDGSGRLSHRNRRHLQKIQRNIPAIPPVTAEHLSSDSTSDPSFQNADDAHPDHPSSGIQEDVSTDANPSIPSTASSSENASTLMDFW